MAKNLRKNYFIQKDFQTRFIARFVVVTTLWSVAAVTLFIWFAGRRLEAAMYSSHLAFASVNQLLLPSTLQAQGLAFLLFALLLAYAIHDLGKRISVPHFMLKNDLARIGSGDLVNPVTLRPGDEFLGLAADLEGMRSELGARFSRIKEKHEAMALAVSDLDRAFLQGLPTAEHIDGLMTASVRMREEINAFTR